MSQDGQLQMDVLAELGWEPSVTASHIGVTARDGVVTLTGHVASFAQKYVAETATRRVKGVRAVAEEIEVRLPFDRKRGDDEIAVAILSRLAWDASVPRDAVDVKVQKGWVTLTGQLRWFYQREAVEQVVRPLLGVVGVSNLVTIAPTGDTSAVRADILEALDRSWFFDPRTISVSTIEGAVQLDGIVHSLHDRQLATAAAWATPGVTTVQNDLAVI